MLLVHRVPFETKEEEMKNDIISVENKILAVVNFFNGKTEAQICEEMEIKPAVFKKWYMQYSAISYKYNWLIKENERLKKMFVDLSLINQVLNDTIAEIKGNGNSI